MVVRKFGTNLRPDVKHGSEAIKTPGFSTTAHAGAPMINDGAANAGNSRFIDATGMRHGVKINQTRFDKGLRSHPGPVNHSRDGSHTGDEFYRAGKRPLGKKVF